MKLEKEITVKANCDYDSLHNDLISKRFKIVEEYQVDTFNYMERIGYINLFEVNDKCIVYSNDFINEYRNCFKIIKEGNWK